MGPGEYVADFRERLSPRGILGLAVGDYTHSTAPNRRYPDIITQRLLKAALAGQPAPYGNDDLEALAKHCTEEEDAAKKVERQVGKSAAAMLLESRIGEQFDAIVTGAAAKGTWVRLLDPPVEGRLVQGFEGVDVGHRVRVQLTAHGRGAGIHRLHAGWVIRSPGDSSMRLISFESLHPDAGRCSMLPEMRNTTTSGQVEECER